ncbi:hypothetical protein NONO_c73630 [Nocardia nova SH22a]|uniref:Collagen triple helix repeat-containing protein n=1 Tax=Nocardia nova SH22a TaxID=1415166 RepID=W5TSH2_9NOCA|nr:collagen-like protein [Nocardia nova]AHH22119.1 hypothetical protein NONO_c73630 [Nocardia nova SH22a]
MSLIGSEPDVPGIGPVSPPTGGVMVPYPGPPGPVGPKGEDGERGEQGEAGPQGEQGVQGETGAEGPQGEGLQIDGQVATYADLPSTGIAEGDVWLAGDNAYRYNGSAWPAENAGTPVRGPQGLKGDTGDTGPKGDQGDPGIQGEKGDPGTTDWNDLDNKPSTFPPSTHAHDIADVTGLQTALDGKESTTNRGAANGYAPLDGSSLVPAAYLPSYVDDVLEYSALASFPATGETGKIYVDLATAKIYRWSGTAYVEISPSPGSTDAVTEGATNKYYTDARVATKVQAMFGTTAGTVAQGNDSRLSDARTPTDAGQVYDFAFPHTAGAAARATGAGNLLPQGVKLQRAVRLTRVIYRGNTADASGNLVVELRKNGSAVSGTSKTIAATDQTAGASNATNTGTWDFDEGDILTVQVTGVGTTPGNGLIADIKGVTR